MSGKIKYVLTAHEWTLGVDRPHFTASLAEGLLVCRTPGDRHTLISGDDLHAAIALANDRLDDGDPRKITPELIDALRHAAYVVDMETDDDRGVRAVADALESYLRPSSSGESTR